MLLFWIICALLVLLALWFVLPAFLQPSKENKKDDRRAANLLVYQDQYQELETDLKNGLIAQEQYQQDKDELERRLLDDFGETSDSVACGRNTDCRFRALLRGGQSKRHHSNCRLEPAAGRFQPTR
jgi:cytochrome c-type biogenesis protein CcmH